MRLTGTEPTEAPVAPLVWTLPGLTRTTVRTATLVVLVPLTAVAGLAFTRQPIFMLLGPAFLAPVLSRYFLRPSYRLTDEVARVSWGTEQTEIRWENVRRAWEDGDRIRLSPLAGIDVRQSFRGVELRLPGEPDERRRIVAWVQRFLPVETTFEETGG